MEKKKKKKNVLEREREIHGCNGRSIPTHTHTQLGERGGLLTESLTVGFLAGLHSVVFNHFQKLVHSRGIDFGLNHDGKWFAVERRGHFSSQKGRRRRSFVDKGSSSRRRSQESRSKQEGCGYRPGQEQFHCGVDSVVCAFL